MYENLNSFLCFMGFVACTVILIVFVVSYITLWLKVDHLVDKLAPLDDDKPVSPLAPKAADPEPSSGPRRS